MARIRFDTGVCPKKAGVSNVHIDVVVCTHGDNDHADGLTDLLDRDGITVSKSPRLS
jgi:beta-lactamase superfamily II metal-dependent hydrolase